MIRFNGGEFQKVLANHPAMLRNVLRDVLVETSVVALEAVVVGNQFGNPTGTPVAIGYARGSWYVENGPPTIQAQPKPENATGDPSGASALSRGVAVITTSAELGTPLHFVNGAEYAVMLEYGWSERQAPQGMVRLTARSAQAILDSVARRL